jgi:haloacetate dehalogenase
MAEDEVAVMRALGHERFAVAGHDRGGRVAYRLALDHPERVTKLAVLDIVPTLETFERMGKAAALSAYHWLFLAQPYDLPERMIARDSEFYLDWTIASWCAPGAALADDAMAEYRRAFADASVIHAACEDYRAGATLDCDYDRADRDARRRIACPVLSLWGARRRVAAQAAALGPLDTWRRWAGDVEGGPLDCGHFLPEEAPAEVTDALMRFLTR